MLKWTSRIVKLWLKAELNKSSQWMVAQRSWCLQRQGVKPFKPRAVRWFHCGPMIVCNYQIFSKCVFKRGELLNENKFNWNFEIQHFESLGNAWDLSSIFLDMCSFTTVAVSLCQIWCSANNWKPMNFWVNQQSAPLPRLLKAEQLVPISGWWRVRLILFQF